MSNRSHFLIRSSAIAGSSCGLVLTALGVPLWLLGVNEWLGVGGATVGLLSGIVIAAERRRR